MGVTGAIFKGLTFDGEDSKDYGVYITGQAVYNSPERDVEMISIPGRDGAFALDRGRFSNIEVTYPAGLFGVDEADFAQAIADFRNMLGSRKGYCRLEDDYNPGEYREAVFKAGLEVTPASLESGQFDIVFECKPQRWLTSGEDAVAVTSGGTITNPTLFDARPMLQVWGYGGIDIDGQELEIFDTTIGRVLMANPVSQYYIAGNSYSYQLAYIDSLLTNDPIEIQNAYVGRIYSFSAGITSATSSNPNITVYNGFGNELEISTTFPGVSWDNIPAHVDTNVGTESGTITVNLSNGTTETISITLSLSVSASGSVVASTTASGTSATSTLNVVVGTIYGTSTKTATGSPLYFDLDIGEAYTIEGGVPVSVNNAVSLPAILPTLKPGSNTITFDNTITQFKVVPRWWQL